MEVTEYVVFGYGLAGVTLPCKTLFHRETDLYHIVKNATHALGWEYCRIENKLQNGTPDILLFRAHEYWLVEAKMLRTKELTKIEDNLKWQPGQLNFMLRAVRSRSPYMLIVGHKPDAVTFCTGEYHGTKHIATTEDFPDYVRCIGLV